MKQKLFTLLTLFAICFSQAKTFTWEEISKQYEIPEWYKNAKFGIFSHWGPQTKPVVGGGWYARHMYMKDVGRETWGKGAYEYFLEHYGHPSEYGFKDVIHSWKAEKLDADNVVKQFKDFGARYLVIMANHHDHFDNFASTHHEWNSVNMGPKRDIVGEFGAAAKKHNIHFGVSVHDDRFLGWFQPAFGADKSGPYKGKKYDGWMTKEDGKGKWWEGYDPSKLYGLPPEKRTPEWTAWVKQNWEDRHLELVNKYNVEMLWFDGYNLPYGKHGEKVAEALFNKSYKEHGSFQAVISGKGLSSKAIIEDVERGVAPDLREVTWQGSMNFTNWFYKVSTPYKQNARSILEILADVVSKNGNMLMSVELYADGRIVNKQVEIMKEVGAWLKLNGEAIYDSKPWKIYGDGSTVPAHHKGVVGEAALDHANSKGAHFNGRNISSPAYKHDEVRYTTQGDVLYMIVLNPKSGELEVPTLGLKAGTKPGEINEVEMISTQKEKLKFEQNNKELKLYIPRSVPTGKPVVFKIKGAI
jgi:alpha-L-fucosidase